MKSAMTLQIATTQDIELEEIQKEPSFIKNVESSIAASLEVLEEQVSVTKLHVPSRRLQADAGSSSGRRLQNTPLKVDYEVYMKGDLEKNRIKSSLEGSFAGVFQKDFHKKEKASGRFLIVDKVKVESIDVETRAVSISDAKVAATETYKANVKAQEDAAAAEALTSSTSKKPTIKSVAPNPSTTMPLVEDTATAPDATGSASETARQVWLVALAMLARWV